MKIFRLNSLRKKILTLLLSVTIMSLLITITVVYAMSSSGFDHLIREQQTNMEHIVEHEIGTIAEDLQELTDMYSEDETFVEAFQAGDRDDLFDVIDEEYVRLFHEHDINVLEFGNTDGTVFLRGHNPGKFDDDKSEIEAIDHALSGESVAGLEFGSSGLTVRAFAPIIFEDEVIGTFQMGKEDTFLEVLADKLQGVTIDLYNPDGIIIESSVEDHLGETIDDPFLLETVVGGEKVSKNNDEWVNSYIPMFDPTGSETIGMIGLTQDVSMIQDTNQQIVWSTFIIFIILVIIILFISMRFSHSIAKPVRTVAEFMMALSKGNLQHEIEDTKRNDEIGELIQSTQTVKKNLQDTLSQIALHSQSVSTQSEDMAQSSREVKEGSEQIAITMQEMAEGTEKQAMSAGDLATAMSRFNMKIEETNTKGEQMRETSNSVLHLTEEGKTLMNSSEKQMSKIDGIVQEAVTRMVELDRQSQEITRLVRVINDIADQTNLLALNAAIEAARAGEAGRGFAVVADEVRNLANQVAESVTEITGFVSTIQSESENVTKSLQTGYMEVEQGTGEIKKTGETFNEISASVSDMVESIQSIAGNLADVTAGSQEMSSSIDDIAAVSEEAAAGVEEAAATAQQSSSSMETVAEASETLANLAEEMDGLARRFKL